MSNFTRLYGAQCPICNGASKRCAENTRTKTIHCKHFESDNAEYQFIDVDKIGFGMWKLRADIEDWKKQQKDQDRETWLRERNRRREKQRKIKIREIKQALSIQSRDREIRQLLQQLTLSPEDKTRLLHRGLSEAQIEKNGYRTLPQQWQPLTKKISTRLPGVARNGKKLSNPSPGILCPVIDERGKFVALRLNNWAGHTDDKGEEIAKYLWLSSSKRGFGIQLPITEEIAEEPLAIHFPEQYQHYDRIGICEGLEYKSAIAANRLGYPVIGFSGNAWYRSPLLFKQAIEAIKSALGIELPKITFLPDAAPNTWVSRSYQRNLSWLKDAGYLCEVAWWEEQEIKKNGDIDEIQSTDKIEFISPQKYLDWLFPQDATQEDTEFLAWLKEQDKIDEKRATQFAKIQWLDQKKIKSDVEIESEYFDYDSPASNTITGVKSPLGTGKSTWIETQLKPPLKRRSRNKQLSIGETAEPEPKISPNHGKLNGMGVMVLGCRNSLLLQNCAKWGIKHIHDGSAGSFSTEESLALCVDSLGKVNPDSFIGKLLILDEINSVLVHLINSKTIKRRKHIIKLFTQALENADRVIVLDGNLSNWVIDYLKLICPSKKITVVNNIYQPQARKFYLLNGTGIKDKDGKDKGINEKSLWLEQMGRTQGRFVVFTDNQVFAETQDNLLSDLGLRVLRIDSKTTPEKHVKKFLQAPNDYLLKKDIDVLIYTSAAESGISIDLEDYFECQYNFLFGVIGVDNILQGFARARDNIPQYLWIKHRGINQYQKNKIAQIKEIILDITDEIINKCLKEFENSKEMFDDIFIREIQKFPQIVIAQLKDQSSQLYQKLQDIENYEKSNLRQCVWDRLIATGHEVIECFSDNNQGINQKLSEAMKETKKGNAHDIYHAPSVSLEQLREYGFDNSWEERCKRTKAYLLHRLPGVEETAIWSPDFVYKLEYQDPNYLNNLENLLLIQAPEILDYFATAHKTKLTKKLLKEEGLCLWDYKDRFGKLEVFQKLGLGEVLKNPNDIYHSNHPVIKAAWKKYSRSCKLKKIMGVLPGIESRAMQCIKTIFQKTVGFSFGKGHQVRQGKERLRIYKLEINKILEPEAQICSQLIYKRWERSISADHKNIAQEVSKKIAENSWSKNIDEALTLTQLGFVTSATVKIHIFNNQAVTVEMPKIEKAQIELEKIEQIKKDWLEKLKIDYSKQTDRENKQAIQEWCLQNPLKMGAECLNILCRYGRETYLLWLDTFSEDIQAQLLAITKQCLKIQVPT